MRNKPGFDAGDCRMLTMAGVMALLGAVGWLAIIEAIVAFAHAFTR